MSGEYGDQLWSKVEGLQHRYRMGERYVYCKGCESSFYTRPTEYGEVNCWQCGADITLKIWLGGGPPPSTEIVVIGP